jgi:hypothetical protein
MTAARRRSYHVRNAVVCAATLCALVLPAVAAFQDSFASARTLAIGGAGVAIVADPDSLAINPAGLAAVGRDGKRQALSASYGGLFLGLSDGRSITQSYVGYAAAPGVGASWKHLNAGGLYTEDRVTVGAARSLKAADDRLAIGAEVELMTWDTAPTVGASGAVVEDLGGPTRLGVTVGAIYTLTTTEGVRVPVGIALHHVNQPDVVSDSSEVQEKLPVRTVFGIGAVSDRMLWAFDIALKREDVDIRTGVEWQAIPGSLFLRGGLRLEGLALGSNLTFGAGVRVSESVRADYAFWLPLVGVSETLGSHRVSVAYAF